MEDKFYASVFAGFKTEKERDDWLMEHGANQSIPRGGNVFSYSMENESIYRDLYDELKGDFLTRGQLTKTPENVSCENISNVDLINQLKLLMDNINICLDVEPEQMIGASYALV